MAVSDLLHINDCGVPLNSVEWLETHHRSKAPEREQMIRDLHLEPDSVIVDAGCGPGLWRSLFADAVGPRGRIIGVDISTESLVAAQQRSKGKKYERQVQYKLGAAEQLPIQPGTANVIFSANLSQYLTDPVQTFAAMGPYLAPGGRIVVKDIDFGTMRFHNIDAELQERVFEARKQWESERLHQGYVFEDNWVGSKLARYLCEAGYEEVQESRYRIVRRYPLAQDFRTYIQTIAEWFVSEGAPLLSAEDITNWLYCFLDDKHNALDQASFQSEETEFVATGVWK